MADLTTHLLGRDLAHPILAAAGPLTSTGEGMIDVAKGGASGIVSVTISPRTATGGDHIEPVRWDRGSLLNAGRWATLSIDDWVDFELPHALVAAGRYGVPLFASVGYSVEEVAEVAPALVKTGVDGLELSCQALGAEDVLGSVRALREAVPDRPLIAKLSPSAPDIGALARSIEPFVDAIACINSVGPGLRIDIETGKPLLSTANGFGWLTGASVRPIAARAVYEVARVVKKPVIGVGGVMTGRDVAELLMLGASAVQVCTAALLEGPAAFKRIATELDTWLDDHGYPSVDRLRGAYVKRWGSGQREVVEKEESPVVSADACIGCTICERVCFYDAIEAPPKVIATVFDAPCFQCGLCVSACPVDALSFRPRSEVTLKR